MRFKRMRIKNSKWHSFRNGMFNLIFWLLVRILYIRLRTKPNQRQLFLKIVARPTTPTVQQNKDEKQIVTNVRIFTFRKFFFFFSMFKVIVDAMFTIVQKVDFWSYEFKIKKKNIFVYQFHNVTKQKNFVFAPNKHIRYGRHTMNFMDS